MAKKKADFEGLKIDVTEDDIARGQSLPIIGPRAESCPVALAVSRTLGVYPARVWGGSLVLRHVAYALPPEAWEFARRADTSPYGEARKHMPSSLSPFSFRIGKKVK